MRWVWDAERKRPRAGLRLAIHLLLLGAVLAPMQIFGAAVPPFVLGPIAFASILGITFGSARWIDRRPVIDLGLRLGPLDVGAGALVGGGSIGLVAVLESASGAADYAVHAPRASGVALIYVAVFFVGVAFQEELVFRGYQLLNLTEGLTSARRSSARAAAWATLTSASVFGLAHAGNAGATLLSTLQVAIAGGSLLAVGFLLTGELGFSIGLHFAWNYTQCVLGMPVSGFVIAEAQLLTRTPHGADWLTGGAFGPEASVLGLVAMLLGTAVSIGYVRARYGTLTLSIRLGPLPQSSSGPPSGDR